MKVLSYIARDEGTVDAALGAKNEISIYILSVILGLAAGFLELKFDDLLLTASLVLAATMLLGALRPGRPWRWTLTVAAFVPLAQFLAYVVMSEKPYRAQIYESFLSFLPGIAGAYGGSIARRVLRELFGSE